MVLGNMKQKSVAMKDRPMRVLHVSKYFYPHDGGIESVCRDIIFALKSRPGTKQMCVCFGDDAKTFAERIYGIPVLRIAPFATVRKQALSIKYYFILRKIINRFRPDVVHVHLPNMLICLYLLFIPKTFRLIIHWHSDIIEQKMLHFCFQGIEYLCLKRADLILGTTERYIAGSAVLRKWRDKCKVCPNIVDPEKFDLRPGDEDAVAALRKKYVDPIVFFCGRHVKYKGLELLIKAAGLVKNPCRFVIAGSGPLTEQLLRSEKSSNISFVGRLSDDELRQHLHAATIFAFPSITKNEAFGVSLAEGLSCGLPAVTFTIPGSGVNVVSVGGMTGVEVAVQTPQALAEGFDTLLSDRELCRRFSENAKKHIREHFTKRILEKVIDEIYYGER